MHHYYMYVVVSTFMGYHQQLLSFVETIVLFQRNVRMDFCLDIAAKKTPTAPKQHWIVILQFPEPRRFWRRNEIRILDQHKLEIELRCTDQWDSSFKFCRLGTQAKNLWISFSLSDSWAVYKIAFSALYSLNA